MRAVINDNCTLCGDCVRDFPQAFISDGERIIQQSHEDEAALETAADNCPVGAIDVYGDD